LILGCNGGFQWLGSPDHIYDSLSHIFSSMSLLIDSPQFLRALTRSKAMTKYIYPSGISRSSNDKPFK
jgi:hypothetical protein